MQFLNQILHFVQMGVSAAAKFIKMAWAWSFDQISAMPWENIGELPLWKILLLVAVAGGIVYLLYKSIRELLEAGQKALAAFATLLSVLVQTILPLVLAGALAAAGAYVVNNVHF
jgi:hypothetical protein